MRPLMFRNNRNRLLVIYATVCAFLLFGAGSPFVGPAMPARLAERGGGSLAESSTLPHSHPAGTLPHTHQASTNNHATWNSDDTEGHSHGPEHRSAPNSTVDAITQLLGRQAAALLNPAAAIPGEGESRAVPNDESRNMAHLANLPRSGTNSDLAFWGNLAVAGNYNGFRVIDITNPANPVALSTVACRGPQNDVSIWNNLLFLSVDRPQTMVTCSQDAPDQNDPSTFEGIRIFDITDPTNPQFVTGVPTDCGSHTHTLIPDLANDRLLIYISSYYTGTGPHCGPGREADPRHKKISIVSVPLGAPQQAAVIATPEVNADTFNFGAGPTIGCHDVSVFLDLHIAAASCMSEGQLWDITDPANPQTLNPITRMDSNAFSFWHSGTFSWDGQYVLFSDETFANGCTGPADMDGRIWIYANSPPYTLLSTFVQPRPPSGSEYCSAHLYNILPATDGSKLFASSWYEGAVDVVNFDNPSDPQEEGFYHARQSLPADTWSAYWYNNYIYAGDITRGFDVYSYTTTVPHEYVHWPYLNPQTQEHVLAGPSPVPTNTPNPTDTPEPPTATAVPPTPTVETCTSLPFTDVSAGDYFYVPVRYLYCRGVVSGYGDNTFRPYNNTTRAQLAKIIVLARGWTIDTTGGPHFRDVTETDPFYGVIETAYNHGIISGYSCGANCLEFRPGNNITRAQLSKVVVLAMSWTIDITGGPHFTDVPETDPFYGFVETAYNHQVISGYGDRTFRPGNNATRGQICKIIYSAITAP